MGNKQSNRARREAARRAAQRRQRMMWGAVVVLLLVGIGAFTLLGGDSDDATPQLAADFELISAEGEPVQLSDYRGQPVAVTFMHTW